MPVLKISKLAKHGGGGETAAYVQNILLCFEMFLAAVGHHYSFTIHPYIEVSMTRKSWREAFFALLDFSDVGADIKEHLGVVGG